MNNDSSSSVSDEVGDSAGKSINSQGQPLIVDIPVPPATQKVDANFNTLGIKETLEIGGKMLLGLAGLCYVLGLIVVTIHLRRYGLNSLSLSQLHYVTAGVWVMLPVLVGIFFCIFVKVFYDSAEEQRKEKLLKAQAATDQESSKERALSPDQEVLKNQTVSKSQEVLTNQDSSKVKKLWTNGRELWENSTLRTILWSVVISVFCFYVAGGQIIEKFGIQLSWKSSLFIPALGTVAFGCISIIVVAFFSVAIKPDQVKYLLMGGVVGIWLFMVYVSLFAGYTYQEIPWATGGGRTSNVELVIATDAKSYLDSVGIEFGPVQNRTRPLTLLLVTETEYIVIKDDKAISIPADSVKSVLYDTRPSSQDKP